MAAEQKPSGEVFDLGKIRELIGLMEQHGLTEVDLRRGDERWKLRRGPADVVQMMPAPGFMPAPLPAPAPVAPAPSPGGKPAETAPPADVFVIKSPTVGTFYESPSPGEPAFVKIGSVVKAESVVCIIEAMKVFNQIPAEVNGTITAVLAKNGDAVEFGQPLFHVRLG
jgi:acetyl-CoA carboxylase biotin carboxyl carrier protein